MSAESDFFDKPAKAAEPTGYVARLIGYLSLAMLAAAGGAVIGATWWRVWFVFGLFGLVSSIGLYLISTARAQSANMKKQSELAQKAEKHLKKMAVVEESFDEISEAVRRIQSDYATGTHTENNSRQQPRMTMDLPATLTPLGCSQSDADNSFSCRLCNISGYGFGLVHDCQLQRGYVLLELELNDSEPVRFIADLLWCEAQQDGHFHSGGKLLELVNPVAVG